MYREVPFGEIGQNVIFWHAWDGKVNGLRQYAPRRSYVLAEDGKVRELGEFGRRWKPSDCGLTAGSLVGTIGQPVI